MKVLIIALVLLCSMQTMTSEDKIDKNNIIENIVERYSDAAITWSAEMTKYATWMFWTLATISMVWTFGLLALKKADIGDFFAEFFKFIMFTGFFWWLLINGPNFAMSIIDSMSIIGKTASNIDREFTVSMVMDKGFEILQISLDNAEGLNIGEYILAIVICIVILVILAVISVNLVVISISGWIVAYGGIFFLGFGGSRFTSDMAIGYFKSVFSVALKLMSTYLLVGIGFKFFEDFTDVVSTNGNNIKEMSTILVVSIILFFLISKVPDMLSSIATGFSVGNIGNFGYNSAVNAASSSISAIGSTRRNISAGIDAAKQGANAIRDAVSRVKNT